MLLGKKWNDSKKQKLNNMVSISFSTSHPKNIIDIYKIPFERTTSHTYIYKCLKNEFNLFFSYEEYTIDFFFFFNCSLHKGIHVSQSVIFVQKKHRTKLSFNKKKSILWLVVFSHESLCMNDRFFFYFGVHFKVHVGPY